MLNRFFTVNPLTLVGLVLLLSVPLFVIGCQSESPSPRPVVVKSSSSIQVSSSSIAEEPVLDTADASIAVSDTVETDSLVKDTVVKSCSSAVSSSSAEESSSSAVQDFSSSSSDIITDTAETVAPIVPDTTIQDIVVDEVLHEALPDSVKDTVVEQSAKDTSLCADVPVAVLCDKRDGQRYRTVRIGSQVWMAQNLNYSATNSWCYQNSLENCSNYGRLYQWTAAMNLDKSYSHALAGELITERHQGVCPDGWYVPNDKDMEVLVQYVKEANKAAGLVNEEVGTSLRKDSGWEENDEEILGTNRYGFAAVPAGYRDGNGSFAFLGEEADFWVAEESANGNQASHWNLYYANQLFSGEYRNMKTFAFSVRCIKK